MIQSEVVWGQVFAAMSWVYSLAWCLSFYGQICENFRLKNVEGMNLNFAAVNLNGFLFYALFNSYGYFVEDLQTGTIEMADLFFALHALAATLYTAAQVLMYPRGSNRLSTSILVFIAAQWVFLLCFSLLIKFEIIQVPAEFGCVTLMGYNKLMCSLLKYIPQLLWNRTRRCTFGWSIFSVLMDLTGGIFSVLETVLETLVVEHFRINITKLILGSLTIVYDLLFVYQHYVLYPSVIEDQKSFEKMEFDSPSTVEMERSIEMQ